MRTEQLEIRFGVTLTATARPDFSLPTRPSLDRRIPLQCQGLGHSCWSCSVDLPVESHGKLTRLVLSRRQRAGLVRSTFLLELPSEVQVI